MASVLIDNNGVARWADQGTSGLNPAPITQAANVLTNVLYATAPTALFAGATITVPYAGTWDLVFSGLQQVSGQFTGGTVTSVNVGSFSVNDDAPAFGAARSFLVPWQPGKTNTVGGEVWNASFYAENRVTLSAGDTVGVKFGILLLPTGTLTAGFTGGTAGQTRLKIVPVDVTIP
jgi:hypothetical protein